MESKTSEAPARVEEAFAFFASLPSEERHYAAVAERFGVSTPTVKRWASKGRWRNRLAEREAQIARKALDKLETTEVASRSKYLRVVELGVVKLARAIAKGEIRGTFSDLDRLVRLKLFLESPEIPEGGPQQIVVNLIRGEANAPAGTAEIRSGEGDGEEEPEPAH